MSHVFHVSFGLYGSLPIPEPAVFSRVELARLYCERMWGISQGWSETPEGNYWIRGPYRIAITPVALDPE